MAAFKMSLNVFSALFAIGAAILWWLSARVRTPEAFAVHVTAVTGSMGKPLGGNPAGGMFVGQAYSNDFQALGTALARQSRLSALAATCAGVAAILQTISAFL